MAYWYVRSVLTDDPHLKKRDLWHFLPMIIFFLAALPNLFSPLSTHVAAATAMVNNAGAMQHYKPTLLSGILSFPVLFLSRPVLVLVYTLWATKQYFHYLLRKRGSSVFSQQYFMTKWLPVLLGSLFVLVISHMLMVIDFTVKGSHVFFTLHTLQILSGLGLTALLISPFFFPAILYGLPRVPESLPTQKSHDNLLGQPVLVKKQKPDFEAEYIQLISQKVDSCMKEYQPYLQPECNLAYISKLIKIPAHHLAYYFKDVKQQTFNDFRNEWRINHAKNLIREGKAGELTLEAIGLLSGFSSRNTFFTAFKKTEGISPGAFVAQWPG
jgi:AraC-like DNA-binding protein